MQADLAWGIWQPSAQVILAIVDTGIDNTHPDLTNKILRDANGNVVGYNALTGEWQDLLKAGVMDPAKVTRSALQNAASIAGLILTTESAVVEKKEEEPEPAAGGHGHMH